MNREKILKKAVDRAAENGWKDDPSDWLSYIEILPEEASPRLIYNHDFAKALWPSGEWNRADCQVEDGAGFSGYDIPLWQGHLQQMVIAEDPIAYLGENL